MCIRDSAYAWPLWVVPMGIYLNKDVFAEAKVDMPSTTWTWDQFVDAAKKTTFKRANGEQVYGFAGFALKPLELPATSGQEA